MTLTSLVQAPSPVSCSVPDPSRVPSILPDQEFTTNGERTKLTAQEDGTYG